MCIFKLDILYRILLDRRRHSIGQLYTKNRKEYNKGGFKKKLVEKAKREEVYRAREERKKLVEVGRQRYR